MTEKRFEFSDDGLTIYDNIKNDHIDFDDDLEDLLNKLHEGNEQLKKENQKLEYDISILLRTHDETKSCEEKWLEETPYGKVWG